MIDPSTADITGRVLECLARFPRFDLDHPVVAARAAASCGGTSSRRCWYGRWGVNYIYGTWQVLRGLRCIGEDMQRRTSAAPCAGCVHHQNADGGWGESIASYDDARAARRGASTPSQTAWALMGLLAAGEGDSPAVRRGVRHLVDTQDAAGTWEQEGGPGPVPQGLLSELPPLPSHLPADGAGAIPGRSLVLLKTQVTSLRGPAYDGAGGLGWTCHWATQHGPASHQLWQRHLQSALSVRIPG